jgi:hypothetical protein
MIDETEKLGARLDIRAEFVMHTTKSTRFKFEKSSLIVFDLLRSIPIGLHQYWRMLCKGVGHSMTGHDQVKPAPYGTAAVLAFVLMALAGL